MSIQDAMRMADKLKIRNSRGFFIMGTDKEPKGNYYPSCAIGAAAQVTGDYSRNKGDGSAANLKKVSNPELLGLNMDCPVKTCNETQPVYEAIIHMYDDHKFSRSKIADKIDAVFESKEVNDYSKE